jgi:DNA invertase Pin-like site-specific DNA recombinase
MAFAYGYGRVSTAKQEMSIQAQETQCRQFYESRIVHKQPDVPWGGFFADSAVSGATQFRKRTAGAALFDRLCPKDHVIFPKMDRAFRSLSDQVLTLETLSKKAVNVHFIDAGVDSTTKIGRLILQILASFAEFERGRISERHKDAFAERRRQGLAAGPPPRGFKVEKRDGQRYFVHNLDELRVMRRSYELYEEGNTFYQIYQAFQLHGLKNPRNGKEISCHTAWEMDQSYRKLLATGTLPPDALPAGYVSKPKTAPTDSQLTPSQQNGTPGTCST